MVNSVLDRLELKRISQMENSSIAIGGSQQFSFLKEVLRLVLCVSYFCVLKCTYIVRHM